MKKKLVVLGTAVLAVIVVILICGVSNDEIELSGQLLLNTYCDSRYEEDIVIYDCSENEFVGLPVSGGGIGAQPVFMGNDKVLFENSSIYEYDLSTGKTEVVYESEDVIDHIAVRDDETISFSKGNLIYLYDMQNKKRTVLIRDNGSDIHSWSDDGSVLYYSDNNKKIKSYDAVSEKMKVIAEGKDPIVSGSYIAFTNDMKLYVKSLSADESYHYNGSCYDYGFSPDGNILLVEDEMTVGDAVKNLFKHGGDAVVLGHSLVAWDYKNNKKTVKDTFAGGPGPSHLICDSRENG